MENIDRTPRFRSVVSPLGSLRLGLDDDGALVALAFADGDVPDASSKGLDGPAAVVAGQLDEYFAGSRTAFDLPFRLHGEPFERSVWEALTKIPYGATRSYGELAASLDAPQAAQAVGRAAARNPIAIVVPCHRLLGSDGALTGYAGGLDRKRRLLALEGALPADLWGSLGS